MAGKFANSEVRPSGYWEDRVPWYLCLTEEGELQARHGKATDSADGTSIHGTRLAVNLYPLYAHSSLTDWYAKWRGFRRGA